jgi:hypothetical protein
MNGIYRSPIHLMFNSPILLPMTNQAPTIGLPPGEGAGAPSSYTKYVTKQFAKMEVREGRSGGGICMYMYV